MSAVVVSRDVYMYCLFPVLTSVLDYQSCARLARTCRCISEWWAEYVAVVDLPQRLARFYRGAAIRCAVSVLRSFPALYADVLDASRSRDAAAATTTPSLAYSFFDVPVSLDANVSNCDEDAVAETIYCGLAATHDELSVLCALNIVRSERAARELHAVSMVHMQQPHTVSATRARQLIASGDDAIDQWHAITAHPDVSEAFLRHIIWSQGRAVVPPLPWWPRTTQMLLHGPRVRAAVEEVLDAICDAAQRRSCDATNCTALAALTPTLIEQARLGSPHALPALLHAYCVVVQRVPRLVAALFGRDLAAAERAVAADRANVAAFQLLYSAASALFAFRVRPRTRGAVYGAPPAVPALVDATSAWRFVAVNGVTFSASRAHLDCVVHRRAFMELTSRSSLPPHMAVSGDDTLGVAHLRGRYECAQRYVEQRIVLAPLADAANAAHAFADTSWLTTIVDVDAAPTLATLWSSEEGVQRRHATKRPHRSGLIVLTDAARPLALPVRLFCGFSKDKRGLVISCAPSALNDERKPFRSRSASTASSVSSSPDTVHDIGAPYPVLLAVVQRYAPHKKFIIHWTLRAMQLRDEGSTLRCALLAMLMAAAGTLTHEPLPRCSDCGRVLSDEQSVERGLGNGCHRRRVKRARTAAALVRHTVIV